MTITTDYPKNFGKAENDLFAWNSSWPEILHKPSGRTIYGLSWTKTDEKIDDELIVAITAFRAELKALQEESKKVTPKSEEELEEEREYREFSREMNSRNSDY